MRLVIGAVIIKHRLKLSDEETVAQIQEIPYLQYFFGLKGFSIQAPFAASLLVEIRKCIGIDVFEQLHKAIINQLERRTPPTDPMTNPANASSELTENNSVTVISSEAAVDSTVSDVISDEKQEAIMHQGRFLLDATVGNISTSVLNPYRENWKIRRHEFLEEV